MQAGLLSWLRIALLPTLLTAACLGGCKRAARVPPEKAEKVAARTGSAVPGDPRLAGLYRASCQTCHAHPESGAPPTLDRAAWDSRWAQGLQTLLTHAIAGYNGMPAGGQCFACTPNDYKALIRFMADRPAMAN